MTGNKEMNPLHKIYLEEVQGLLFYWPFNTLYVQSIVL